MTDYLIHLGSICAIYGILAITLNLVVGYTGLLSLAHAAFFGIGAYTTGICMTRFSLGFFQSMGIGVAIAGVCALTVGVILSKFKDDTYALGSLGLNVIIFSFFLNLQELTRGPLGIPGIQRPRIGSFVFSDNLFFLLLTSGFLAGVILCAFHITRSSFGRVLKGIREDEKTLQVFGYRTYWYKLIIFIISAMGASSAGSLFASYVSYIDPFSFTIHESVFLLALIIFGGLASIRGALAGAIILVLLPEFLRFVGFPHETAAHMRQFSYGLLLLVLMILRPQGLYGTYRL